MNMKKRLNKRIFLVLPLFFLACNSEEKKSEHSEKHSSMDKIEYSCPMHPEVIRDSPGSCPICKMDLELKISDASDQIVSPNKQVLSRQSTVKLNSGKDDNVIMAKGQIEIDRSRNKTVSARFGGRIEKLYVKYEFQKITKGEKILEIYSAEFNTVQEEHLFLLKANNDQNLIEQSRQKLKFLGMTDGQITQLEKSRKFAQTISIYSPASGYIIFNDEVNSSQKESDDKNTMGSMGMATNSSTVGTTDSYTGQMREGAYVNKGDSYFSVNDLVNVWAIVSVSATYFSSIAENMPIKIYSEMFPDKPFDSRIMLIERTFENSDQRFIRLRVKLPNKNKTLKINSLLTAEISLGSTQQFRIPISAVYRTGLNAYVWVKTGTTKAGTGIFTLRKVSIGSISDGMVSVINGLSADEEVAKHAGFLTDSETYLNVN